MTQKGFFYEENEKEKYMLLFLLSLDKVTGV